MKSSLLIYFISFISCNYFPREIPETKNGDSDIVVRSTELTEEGESSTRDTFIPPITTVNKNTGLADNPFNEELIAYAKTLIGTPYKYASINPADGFDCSGFITYVFNHFGVQVPRSSVDFTDYGLAVDRMDTESGDLILFTGTDSLSTEVGHMGIVTENRNGEILFIHSTSGKANGVTITPLNSYYLKRFVKIIRIPLNTDTKL
ncbi:MAG: C40 family peptidase [Lacibacter sp.]